MARHHEGSQDEHLTVRRTRTGSAYVSIAIAVILLILLIDFIAQNNAKMTIHFLGANGSISRALALLISAVAGAAVVLLVGSARIVQLRLGARRHNRAVKQAQRREAPHGEVRREGTAATTSTVTAPQREPQPVEPEHKA
jgi:uncharacterized integral membrane protein